MYTWRPENLKEAAQQRKASISELHFTYKGLLRMLPNLVRRAPHAMAGVLGAQLKGVEAMLKRLLELTHEEPPRLRLCQEAGGLLDALHHADRAFSNADGRGPATLSALVAVRVFLVREWSRLLDVLPEAFLPDFRAGALDMQRQEMMQHAELVALAVRIGSAGGEHGRGA